MDKIIFSGMEFYGYHGVYPEENSLGQQYKVDVELYMDLQQAGQSDDLQHTLNYADLYKLVQEKVEGQPLKLIEALAEQIAQSTLQEWLQVEEIVVRVTKPHPPIPGHYDSVAVEIRRKRMA